jgi:stage II sporulation protein AA (anti-sigma F factor antagonist)
MSQKPGGEIMSVNVFIDGLTLVAQLTGDLDMVTGAELKKAVDQRWDDFEKLDCLVLDLTNVSFTDSTGLGAILGRYKKVKTREGDMIIVGAKGGVKEDLEIAGILKLCKHAESLEDINCGKHRF